MIPATMAVLVPMALGRKKRDLNYIRLENSKSSQLGRFPSQFRNENSERW